MVNLKLSEKGFTLIELLATIIILSIIAMIAVVSIINTIQNQRDKAVLADIVQLVDTARIFYADEGCIDQKCEYNLSSSELEFKSVHFTEGTVDFTEGSSLNEVEITINIDPDIFQGKHKDDYKDLIEAPFTEEALRNILK